MGDIHIPSHVVPIGLKDSLVVESFNSLASPAVDVFVRYMDEQGRIHRSGFRHTPKTDRSSATSRFRVGRGHLLSVALEPVGYTPRRGQTFIRAFLTRDDVGTVQPDFPIISDYLVSGSLLAWPGSPLRSSVEGPGIILSAGGLNPGVGQNPIFIVPSGVRYRLLMGRATLVTDANVANRSAFLQLTVGGTVVGSLPVSHQVPAATTRSFTFVSMGELLAVVDDAVTLIPDELFMFSGDNISYVTNNIQAGDDWSPISAVVEEWLEP